ncbi:hypothetical protein MH076_07945 [Bacillus altitudinis]|uniref:hypothetical protein n=1 Tax=Bacillus altitudinis TaxID=293387 RepID=UPI00227E95C3|nr:hypothetical protein [Bacillus altitudinis]MCY7686155.1 hypothetical protein [Bacillus altitudinis]MCY7701793.1 hypothetical protein [Bacillus altitudinis]
MKKSFHLSEEKQHEFVVEELEFKLNFAKKELEKQFKLREKELFEYKKTEKKYAELEKKYQALRNSFLGKLTINYWTFRRKIKNKVR